MSDFDTFKQAESIGSAIGNVVANGWNLETIRTIIKNELELDNPYAERALFEAIDSIAARNEEICKTLKGLFGDEYKR